MAAAGDVILFTFLLHAWIWSGGFGDVRGEDEFAHVGFLRWTVLEVEKSPEKDSSSFLLILGEELLTPINLKVSENRWFGT